MFTKSLIAAAFVALTQATTEIASTCIAEQTHMYGANAETDLPFTDYNYLVNTEEFNMIYRMTRLTLCENAEGDLVGLRSHVTRFNAETNEIDARISMNKIGTNQDTGVTCNSIILDAENGEYLTGMYIAWQNPGQIDYIRATSNKNQQISKGTLTNSMQTGEITSIHSTRILAFHGYENDRIASIGQVSVDLDCIKGVTTVESIEEPILVDVGGIGEGNGQIEQQQSVAEANWVYILVGVVIGVLLMVAATVIAVMYKQKKGCFKKAAGAQGGMPIAKSNNNKVAQDIEFAGQSLDQKRKSIKAMSKIVEVDEDLEDSKKSRKNKVQYITSDDNQSVQNTDIEEVAPNRNRQTS